MSCLFFLSEVVVIPNQFLTQQHEVYPFIPCFAQKQFFYLCSQTSLTPLSHKHWHLNGSLRNVGGPSLEQNAQVLPCARASHPQFPCAHTPSLLCQTQIRILVAQLNSRHNKRKQSIVSISFSTGREGNWYMEREFLASEKILLNESSCPVVFFPQLLFKVKLLSQQLSPQCLFSCASVHATSLLTSQELRRPKYSLSSGQPALSYVESGRERVQLQCELGIMNPCPPS